MNPQEQMELAVQAAIDKKGLQPVVLDVRDRVSYTDFIVLISGRSDRHVQALAEAVLQAFADRKRKPLGVEGARGQWTLIDFGDIVVHVFHHPMREYYDLEGLWCDAPRVALDLPEEELADLTYSP